MNRWLIEGRERHEGQPLRIVYTGHEPGLIFVRDLAFGQDYQQKHVGRAWALRQPLPSLRHHENALYFTEVSDAAARRHSEQSGFYIPMWVNGVLDIEKSLARSKTVGNIKEDLRRIRKNKLDYEVTKDDERVADFHRNMYVPYIKNTFGDGALYHSLAALRRSRGTTELLVIRKNGEAVAGQILVHENGNVRTREIGVKDGDRQFVKLGVMGAIYYFGLLHLQSEGYSTVSLGGSRAWLKDGVIQFKKKWGMRIDSPWPSGLLLDAPTNSDGVAAFLENNPFMCLVDNQLHGVLFSRKHHDINADGLRRLHRDYFFEGMSKLEIYPLSTGQFKTEIPDDIASVIDRKESLWQYNNS